MALFQIPFSSIPQRFAIDLGGTTFVLVNRWNPSPGGGWYIDIYDADEAPLVMCIPLVPGVDLFDQFNHLGFPGQLIVYTEGDEGAMPTLDNLGTESNVWLVT